MPDTGRTNILIVGAGRVGTELAESIAALGRPVTLLDANPRAFDRLSANYRGRTVQGDGMDRDALLRAGIETALGLAAVTSSDSTNVVAARIARDIFHVPHVVARVYDPSRAPIYEKLALPTVASSSWGARRIEQLLLHPGLQSVYAAGNGEVQLYEIKVPDEWEGRLVRELVPDGLALPVALARGGRAQLPQPGMVLRAQDVLHVSATAEGAALLRQRLKLDRRP